MSDRIADPWGPRTPYAPPGELATRSPWPVRIDCFLGDGVRADDVDRWVQTASILHSNGDGLDIAVKDGRIVGVQLFSGTRSGPIGLLRDLHDLYLMAALCDMAWTLIGQAAQGVRDQELLAVVRRCEGATATQMKWLRTRMKQSAPQALVVAD